MYIYTLSLSIKTNTYMNKFHIFLLSSLIEEMMNNT